jgi:hypothetical protein
MQQQVLELAHETLAEPEPFNLNRCLLPHSKQAMLHALQKQYSMHEEDIAEMIGRQPSRDFLERRSIVLLEGMKKLGWTP